MDYHPIQEEGVSGNVYSPLMHQHLALCVDYDEQMQVGHLDCRWTLPLRSGHILAFHILCSQYS